MSTLPATISRYQVLQELGHGAMGMVYLAVDPLLKRKVAIKVMKDRSAEDSVFLERFRREAETSSSLNHPNIITVYDVGEDPVLGPFMAMEYVEGSSLTALIRGGRLTRPAAFRILSQVMMGLLAAGSKNIVHRDVKSDNILVGVDERVKLMDFGIARAEGTRLTATGTMVGTPAYIAPELIQGQQASLATDLYAFAVTAFEVFTGGALPFKGDSLVTTLYHIVHDPPELPPTLPPPLAAVLRKALAKDPAARYPNLPAFMNAVADALGLPHPELPKGLQLPAPAPTDPGVPFEPLDEPTEAIRKPASDPAIHSSGHGEAAVTLEPPPAELFARRTPHASESHPGLSADPAAPREPHPPQAPTHPRPPSPHAAAPSPRTSLRPLLWGLPLAALAGLGIYAYSHFGTRTVVFRTIPPQAMISVDDQPLGLTPPGGLRAEVRRSARVVEVVRDGYADLTRSLDARDRDLTFTLHLLPGTIRIYSQPEGAKVYLDGRLLPERTPVHAHSIGSGTRNLRVILPGYKPFQAVVSEQHPPPEPILLERAE